MCLSVGYKDVDPDFLVTFFESSVDASEPMEPDMEVDVVSCFTTANQMFPKGAFWKGNWTLIFFGDVLLQN